MKRTPLFSLMALTAAMPLLAPQAAHAQGYTLQSVSFQSTTGVDPYGGLTDVGGTLYGTASLGGAKDYGSIFSYTPGSSAINRLASFTGGVSGGTVGNGSYPLAGLTNVGGTLYGITSAGGANNDGTVFSFTPGSTALNLLASFTVSDGTNPYGALTDVGGTLYGTTESGGSSSDGTIFSYTPGSSAINLLASFTGGNGASPYGALTDVGGVLYGTTYAGGSSNGGTVFSYDTTSQTPGIVNVTAFSGSSGVRPYAGLTYANNLLYGTTSQGGGPNGNQFGTIFSYTPGASALSLLATFTGGNGSSPYGALTAAGGTLYGTTEGGSSSNSGTVFSYDTTSKAPTIVNVTAFSGSNGANPRGALIDVSGTLYGTTYGGNGASSNGTVFALVPSASPAPEPSELGMLSLIGLTLGGLLLRAKRRRVTA